MARSSGFGCAVLVAAGALVAGDLAAQAPGHRDRAEIRDRFRAPSAPVQEWAAPLQVVGLQPLVFRPAEAGQALMVDPLVDQDARAEFELIGPGWVEVSVSVQLETDHRAPVVMQIQPDDLVFVDAGGSPIPARPLGQLREANGVLIRHAVLLDGSGFLHVGGVVAPGTEQEPGVYTSRITVHMRPMDL